MSRSLNVAVIGAGPSGLYAVDHLLQTRGLSIDIDVFERLPTPWGLVRGGVAPDHPEKKQVIDRLFAFTLSNPRVRFLGNVDIGKTVQPADLAAWYDAVIYAIGADGDTAMRIPGEDLAGCWSAREFVGFYNGHPDFADLPFDLSCERAVIVGNGNVALDVARLLTLPLGTLERTDIAEHALAALRKSAVREVVILGRRGPSEAAFHNPELEELEHQPDVDVRIEGGSLPDEQAMDDAGLDWNARRKIDGLRRLVARTPAMGGKRIIFQFLRSPITLLGDGRVEQMRVAHTILVPNANGTMRAQESGETSTIATGAVFRAIGYRGQPFAGLPFDDARGVIDNIGGRIVERGQALPGIYVTGWIKRGCKGVIGSNKKCARETVASLLDDFATGRIGGKAPSREDVMDVLRSRGEAIVSHAHWRAIDRAEQEAGRRLHRPRVKFAARKSLLDLAFGPVAPL